MLLDLKEEEGVAESVVSDWEQWELTQWPWHIAFLS